MKIFWSLMIASIIMVSCNSEEEIPAPEYKNAFFEMPEDRYGGLYRELQLYDAVPQKDLADAIPLRSPRDIYNDLRRAKNDYDFEMEKFIRANFKVPERTTSYRPDSNRSIEESIELLWGIWKKPADDSEWKEGSHIPLKHPYVTDHDIGNDVNYWNAYYTMLGLAHRNEIDLLENMVKNFADLIETFGFIPYNNRTYNTSRSNYPVFVEMVELLAKNKGDEVWDIYLPYVEKEYNYWMIGADDLSSEKEEEKHVVWYKSNILNRYWDDNMTPRPEHYRSDDRDAGYIDWRPKWKTLREFRAVTESGWNFSSRFMNNGRWRGTTVATEILPVDLNCALYHYEEVLADKYAKMGNDQKSKLYADKAAVRKKAILTEFWRVEEGIFEDVKYVDSTLMKRGAIAMMYPLYFKMVGKEKADSVASYVENRLLKEGGVIHTEYDGRQRWDRQNGWAQMQYITVKGLRNYGYTELADKITSRWIKTVERVYTQLYRFNDYYNVEEIRENFEDTSDTLNYTWTVAVYEILKEEAEAK